MRKQRRKVRVFELKNHISGFSPSTLHCIKRDVLTSLWHSSFFFPDFSVHSLKHLYNRIIFSHCNFLESLTINNILKTRLLYLSHCVRASDKFLVLIVSLKGWFKKKKKSQTNPRPQHIFVCQCCGLISCLITLERPAILSCLTRSFIFVTKSEVNQSQKETKGAFFNSTLLYVFL